MGARQGLNELAIATKALEMIDAQGVEALAMRPLAAALGVRANAIYHYFSNKDALLEGVTQLVLAQVSQPLGEVVDASESSRREALDWKADGLDWKQVIQRIMRSFRVVGLRHPHMLNLLLRYAPRTPSALDFVDYGFRILLRAGFDGVAIARSYTTLAQYSFGSLAGEVNQYFDGHPAVQRPAGSLDIVSLAQLLPAYTRIGPILAEQDPEDQFEYGLELILEGLARLEQHHVPSPRAAVGR